MSNALTPRKWFFSLQLLAVLRVQITLSNSQADECDSSNTNSEQRPKRVIIQSSPSSAVTTGGKL